MNSHHSATSGAAWQVALGALCISLAAPLVKSTAVAPETAAVFRMFFGALALAGVLCCAPEWRRGWRTGWSSSALIALFFTLDLWFWHRSIHWLGPGLATLLANFQVFLLPLVAGWLYGERPKPAFYLGLALAALGLLLLFGLNWQQFSGLNRWGIGYGLLTALAYSAYLLSLRHYQSKGQAPSAAARLFQVCVWSALMLALIDLPRWSSYAQISSPDWLRLIALGVLCQVMGWLFITRGLPGLSAAVAGLLLLLQPSLSLTWDHFWFGLALSHSQMAGVVICLLGIYCGSALGKRPVPKRR